MHVIIQIDICLILDKHESIKNAYNNPKTIWQNPPPALTYYIRHIAQNFMREIKDKSLHKKIINMGKYLYLPFQPEPPIKFTH